MIGDKTKRNGRNGPKFRVWLNLTVLLTVALHGGVTPDPVKAVAFQTAASVGIGGARVSPTTIAAQSSSSNFRVSIATGTSVEGHLRQIDANPNERYKREATPCA